MTRAACYAEHEAIKADPKRWSELEHVGSQHFPADDTGPAMTLELRNCSCGSTLALEVQP